MNNLPAKKNRRILIVDDNRAIHDDFRKILSPRASAAFNVAESRFNVAESRLFGKPTHVVQQIQYEVDSAYQGQDGLMLVKQALQAGRPYAMAFVDIRMPPGWDGVETTQQIWAVDPELQIVICTAYADYSWDEMFEKIGNCDGLVILKKPFDTVEALQLAQALTEKWWLHQQSRQKMEELESMVAERTTALAKTNEALRVENAERKRTEETLRKSEERFSGAFEYASIGVALVAPDGRWLKVNRALCDLVGYSEAELLTRTFQDITHPQDLEIDLENVRRMIARDIRSFQMEKRYIHARGHLVAVLLNVSLVRDGQGQPRYFISQIQDITGRKMAETAAAAFSILSKDLSFAAAPEEASQIISEAADKLLKWDAFSIQLYSVETGTITSLFDADTVDGKRIQGDPQPSHKPSDLQRSILDSGAKLILREQPDSFLPGGSPFGNEARPSASLLFVPIRSKTRTVGIMTAQSYTPNAYGEHDLRTLQTLADQGGGALERIWVNEALRKSEAQLFQSQKLETVGKLAGGIAHEFNSIMTAIIGQSELILGDLPSDHPLSQNAAGIRRAAERAATLTRQLLAYGRRAFLRPESLDLNRVIASTEGMFCQFMGSDVDVRIVPAEDLHAVKADAGQIEQVIVNLAMNAADAMPKGGKLTLETANVSFDQESVGRYPELKPGDYVMLAITDTGAGMSAEVKARVFEPFFTTKGVGQGTGLGLSTCYGIIKQSGGHISVYSESGRGTTFKIYLPQIEPQAEIPLPRLDLPDLPRGTETILLVEDDPALRELAATLLRRLGYTVLAAANGIEALSLKRRPDIGHIDLLFTDVVMPHMSGKELAERVRALYPHTRILFTSAYTGNAIVHQGVLDQGVALLQKPFTPSALARKLREVLDQPGAPEPDIA